MTDEPIAKNDTTGQTKRIDWGFGVCGSCDRYVLSPSLLGFGAIRVCKRCYKDLIERGDKKRQIQLFDDQTSLF